jgi:hypothetical protein
MKSFTIIISFLLLSYIICEKFTCDLDRSEGSTPELCDGLALDEFFIQKGYSLCCYFEGKEKSSDSEKIIGCIPVTEEQYKDPKLLEKDLKEGFEEVDRTICGENDSYSYYLNIVFLSLLFIIL